MEQTAEASERDLFRVRELLGAWSQPWWVAGGWAIDLCADANPRRHHDIDIAVLRRDQLSLQLYFADWSLKKAISGKLVAWHAGEYLSLPVHEIHAEGKDEHLEFLLNEARDDVWLFRRNLAISLPLSDLTRRSSEGIPFLCPQVVLLYKSKDPRPVDEEDFERALPLLNEAERGWLGQALEICHPGHHWRLRL
jgi:hypothetical protein